MKGYLLGPPAGRSTVPYVVVLEYHTLEEFKSRFEADNDCHHLVVYTDTREIVLTGSYTTGDLFVYS